MVSFGAVILTVNVVLLGGTIGFFQSLCLLGYCIFPLDVAAIVCVSVSALRCSTGAEGRAAMPGSSVPQCTAPSARVALLCTAPARGCPPHVRARHYTGTPSTIAGTWLACVQVKLMLVRWIVVGVAIVWSSWASIPFVAGAVPVARKALAIYPLVLLYVCVGWIALIT